MELLKNLEGLSADEQMTAVVELQKAAMKHLEEQKQASIGKSAELVIQGLKKIKSDFEAKFDSLNYDIQTKVASLKDGEQGLQGPKGDQGERGLDGSNGRDGRDGKDGKDGLDGVDGVGVRDAKIDFDGSLVISLTDGREINCGEVVSVDVAKQIQKVTHNIQTGAGGDSQTVLDAIAAIQATIATYGTMATQNKTSVDIEGGTIDNTTIGATTPSTGVFTTLTATGQTSLGGVAGSESLRVETVASAVNYLTAKGSTSGSAVSIGAAGLNGGIATILQSKGSGTVEFWTNGGNQRQMAVSHTASAVNYVQVTGAATNNNPTISAQGSDSSAGLIVAAKGYSGVEFQSGGRRQFLVSYATGNTEVNYNTAKGSNTGMGVQFQAAGSDTNISQVFQSKGAGAIDLAAGSSGVNISNGGTVTAITRTATGSSYTGFPTIAISAPTTAGGVQATANAQLVTGAATVVSGGTGYTNGDTLTVSGGSSSFTITVTGVTGGVITSATTSSVALTSIPSNPVSVTGGTGTGATFNITYGIAGTFTITNAGSGYVEQPTVTFSGGGGSGAAAFARVGGAVTLTSLGSTLNLNTEAGTGFRVLTAGTTATDMWQAISNGNTAILRSSNATSNGQVQTSGTGGIQLGTNSGVTQCLVAHTASAVNYVQVTGSATTGYPVISAQGSDSSAGLILQTKGSGYVRFSTGGGPNSDQLRVNHTANPVNYAQITGAVAGASPVFSVAGSDTNISLVLQPKGTGALQAQQTDSTATGGNARGANAVDWQTVRGSASQIASGQASVVIGGNNNTASGTVSSVVGGLTNLASGYSSFVGGGWDNNVNSLGGVVVGGKANTSAGYLNFIGSGQSNSGTSASAVTTQSGTMNGTTAVTLSGSNASIKVGQYVTGTSIATFTYVAAISGTSLTLSQAASGSSTSTLSFYTPHGVVVGGGNNQATGSYSFIGGGGDAGTAANRNVASGDWSTVVGGYKNTASGIESTVVNGDNNTASGTRSFIGAGQANIASATGSAVFGGRDNNSNAAFGTIVSGVRGNARGINTYCVFASSAPISETSGGTQAGLLIIARQTTDATPTVLAADGASAGTTNQVILPNNSAYYFKVEIIANVTGGGNTSGWELKGVIKRGANAASTAIVGSVTSTLIAQDAGASTWAVSATADTTNGGLKITCTGQASTTIRWVAKASTTEVTF